MIPSAPADFWEIVARRVAKAIFDRETNLERARFTDKVPNLATVPPQGVPSPATYRMQSVQPEPDNAA